MLRYANMKMERTWQGYDARSCLKMMLNRLKEMNSHISIYTPLKTLLKEAFKEVFMCASSKSTMS
jgi:hypothetical protein